MNMVLDFISENNELILLAVTMLLLFTWVFFIINIKQLKRSLKKYKELTKYTGETSVENILEEYGRKIYRISINTEKVEKELAKTVQQLKHYPQYHSIVRFNAFGNTGSDLSFAIALLDNNFDGFVITSIYGREESITYAKPIENGLSSYHLTKEEEKAIQLAKDKKIEGIS